MPKVKRSNSMNAGGAATQAGTVYESNVTVFYVVHMLAGSSVQPPIDLAPTAKIASVHCQINAPVDDVMLAIKDGGFAFLQAKRTLTLGPEFDKTIREIELLPNPWTGLGMN